MWLWLYCAHLAPLLDLTHHCSEVKIICTVAMLITSDKEAKAPSSVPPLDVELTSHGFPQGYFMLRSIGTGRMLDVCQGLKEDGTAVILWPATESSLVECEQ